MSITPLTLTALALFGGIMIMPFFGMPPLQFGYYLQVEGMIPSFWLMGGLAGVWAFWLTLQRPKLARYLWELPVIWGWIPLILFSAVQSIFLPIPLQSWTGFGQLGEGIFSFLAHMFLTFVLSVLIRLPRLRPFILWLTFLSGTLVAGLTIIGCAESPIISMRFWPWAPLFFPDFIAYIAAAFMGMYVLFFQRYRQNVLFHALFLSSMILIGYYSRNQSGYYAVAIAVAVLLILEAPILNKLPVLNKLSYQKKVAIIFLSILLSLTIFIMFYDVFSAYLPTALANQASIIGRTYLTKMTFIELTHKVLNWKDYVAILFGKGWGEYGNSLLGNVFLFKDIALFNGENWQPTWEFTHRDMLHSHNTLTEHFLSVGLIGVGLYLWVKYKTILSLKRHNRYAGVLFLIIVGVMNVFWFPIIHTFPYLMVANALLFTRPVPMAFFTLPRLQLLTKLSAPTLLIFSLIHTTFIALQGKYAYIDMHGDLIQQIDAFSQSLANRYEALEGGRRWVAYVRSFTKNIHMLLEDTPEADVPAFAERARQMAHDLYTGIPHAGNYYSLLLPMNIYGELASRYRTQKWVEENPQFLNEWDALAQAFILYLPFRSDILIPYLNYLMFHQQEEKAYHFVQQLLEHSPRDPVGLWFKGTLTLMKDQDRNAGICLLKKAIDEKITRYMPLPPTEVKRIQETFAMCPAPSWQTHHE